MSDAGLWYVAVNGNQQGPMPAGAVTAFLLYRIHRAFAQS